ncbi:uncharacterized protein EKO05_0010188 [Ascochyta rabiei]|nr:uncharacterized protein EKO05_0010188 [Ascochyta rabiei]UPX19939.1 hypothetical protein EKO05_0010188 [Ascochyta rabiei]
MATAWRRREMALHHAVLDELTKSLDGSTDAPKFDIQHLIDASEYQMDAEIRMDALDDDDWQDVKKNRDDKALPSDRLVQLYDKERNTMYHVWKSSFEESRLAPKSDSNDVSTCINVSSKEGKPEEFNRQEVDEALGRLTLENGQCLPHGYQDWIARKLQSRFSVENDIPGYANLCELCHRVLTHSWVFYYCLIQNVGRIHSVEIPYIRRLGEMFHHYETIEALHASASAGCHLCSILAHAKDSEFSTCVEGCIASYYLEFNSRTYGSFCVYLSGCSRTRFYSSWTNVPPIGLATLKHANTDASEIISLAKSWLTRCLDEDGRTCMISTRFRPSRLVKIIATHDSLESACVVLRDEMPADVQYLTLSHCWGKAKMVKLEKSTYKDYLNQLPLSILSKTFQEALKVTVWLGYRYIWIDSLCILQDSDSDWKNEAAMMGAIYRHSTCTIAATGAKDGDGGLFFKRSALAFVGCPLYRRDEMYFLAQRVSEWPSPLSSRAWALQERFLSPRVLSFGSDKISWSCGRTEVCEGPYAHRVQLNSHAFPRLLDPRTDAGTAYVAWGQVVLQYSICNLTLWKDRWPAFQGLASEVAKAQNWKIVHGLRSHLISTTELLWHTYKPEAGAVDIGEPSWSWLNIKSRVLLHIIMQGRSSDAQIVLQDSSAGEESGDDIRNGVIRIEAHMAELKSDSPSEDFSGRKCDLTTTNPRFQAHSQDRLLKAFWYPDSISICEKELWALQIATKETYATTRSKTSLFEGLVVIAAKGRPGFWRRVGRYEAWNCYENGSEQIHPWVHEKKTIYLI